MPTSDFMVKDEGTIWLFYPLSERADQWVQDNVQDDAQFFGTALVVEHRYAPGLILGIEADGLEVEEV